LTVPSSFIALPVILFVSGTCFTNTTQLYATIWPPYWFGHGCGPHHPPKARPRQTAGKKGSVAGFAAKSMAQKALNWESNLVDAVIGPRVDFIFILTKV
jgi:hypothetical protein